MRRQINHLAKWIWVLLLPCSLLAQERAISGKITDASRNPLFGVSVAIKQSNRGTVTDANGQFTLSVPSNSTLVISFVGYVSQTIQVDNQSSFDIRLADDVGRLDEVVVTGLATGVKRRNLSNAIATISNKQLQGTAPAQTFDAAINGKIPGAYVMQYRAPVEAFL